MELKLKSEILEYPPNVVQGIRKKHNLDQPGRMEEAIEILNDWIKKQNHFLKKDFPSNYLETCLISCKGSIERTKIRLDRLCTLRTLLPEFFEKVNPKKDLYGLENLVGGPLPKLDSNYYRTYIMKNTGSGYGADIFLNYYKLQILTSEYLRMNDYTDGFYIIFDYTDINLMDLMTALNLVELRNILSVLMQGYGMRIKGIHLIVSNSLSSSIMEMFVNLIKQVLTEKIRKRLYVHKTLDSLYEHVPREVLPRDYGGDEKMTLREIYDKWLDVLSSDEHMNFMKEINKARVDESLRMDGKFNEDYLGLPGSFRTLNVD